jgi:hypothetical protein
VGRAAADQVAQCGARMVFHWSHISGLTQTVCAGTCSTTSRSCSSTRKTPDGCRCAPVRPDRL